MMDNCYNQSNMQTHQHVVSFESHPEIYNLSSGMEMIGFPSKHHDGGGDVGNGNPSSSSAMWKEFFAKQPGPSKTGEFYSQEFNGTKPDFSTGITVSDTTTHEEISAYNNVRTSHHHLLEDVDPSLRIVFEGHERPNQGLSLSLGSSNNPSSIGIHSFDLRQHQNLHQQQQQMIHMQDGFFAKNPNLGHHLQIRSSKYLGPAQELLNEFCNLGAKQGDHQTTPSKMKGNQWQDQDNNETGSSKMQCLYSLDLLELQKRKAKLLQMLEEVERRYKHYCNQMKAVVSSFEAVAGNGAATVYSALASEAMSRHFRCVRDGIVGQIKATKKALGEKDVSAPGTTRGETPRLRLLDQTLRQQRAYQQMSMMESHPWRPQRGLPERAVSVLRAWLFEHFLHPYPSDVDKHILARQTGLSRSQVSNWFINARVRLWKPMVEEMYNEENKEMENNGSMEVSKSQNDDHHQNPNHHQDQKPTSDQLVRIDSECLSSIINHPEKNDINRSNRSFPHDHHHQGDDHHHFQGFGRVSDVFGAVELDFSAYNHHYGSGAGGGGGGAGSTTGVSLTLGLQQHGGSLGFSPASQNSMFYSREQLEDCQPVHQYSLLGNDEGQNLPYRNLMGAQLLHDLAG